MRRSVGTSYARSCNVKPGETTADGEFTVIPSECLAACDRAPMMLVDDKVVGPVKEGDLDQILDEAKKGPGHPSPMEKVEVSTWLKCAS